MSKNKKKRAAEELAIEGDEQEAVQMTSFVAYANKVSVRLNVYDVALVFSLESPGHPANNVTVHMSPQHAKSLHLILTRLLERYAQQVGPIALPKQLEEQLLADQDEEQGGMPS